MSLDTSTYSQNELTNNEKNLYNVYLAALGTALNRPFKIRNNFDKFDPEKIIQLKKIHLLLKKYPNISWYDFFIAPYKVYSDSEFYDLNFYNTRKALVCYTRYIAKKETASPDTEETITACKEIYKFLFKYCQVENIKLDQYIRYTPANYTVPAWLVHLKEHKTNFYVLHSLGIDSVTKQVNSDLLNFYIQDFFNMLTNTRTKYMQSTKLKNTLTSCFNILTQTH